jgi:tetratricopeptide (TPR) repeat protein
MARSAQKRQVALPGWLLSLGLIVFAALPLTANELNELSLDGWKQLRETERYQLQIAEKYARDANWKVAAAEYEKFLELYESSSGAPYAQLKWSIAQVQLRKQNTAIKEGFQSVIDYWPDSPQAIAAAYYIGQTYKEIGRVKEAKKALRDVVSNHPQSLAAVLALGSLVDITTIENDIPARVELWKKLVFEIKRTRDSNSTCVTASQQLAAHLFREGLLDDGVKALATTYSPEQLPTYVHSYLRAPLTELAAQSETLPQAGKLAEQAAAWFRTQQPADLSTPEAKAKAKQLGLAGLDALALAKKDDTLDAAYEQLHKLVGPDDDVLGRFAAYKKSRTKWDDARAIYRRYASRTEGLNQIAYSHREQANYPLAIEAYQQCLAQVEPENAARIKAELAVAYRQAKKVAEAVAVYEELYTSEKQNPNKWRWEIAQTFRDANQLKEAIGHFRQCDNFPENYKQMAWCHRQLKQHNEAITLYNQVASDAGSAPWALLQIGYTREEAGQQEPAIQAFQLVCKKFPADSNAALAHAHLQTKYKISVTLGGAKDE